MLIRDIISYWQGLEEALCHYLLLYQLCVYHLQVLCISFLLINKSGIPWISSKFLLRSAGRASLGKDAQVLDNLSGWGAAGCGRSWRAENRPGAELFVPELLLACFGSQGATYCSVRASGEQKLCEVLTGAALSHSFRSLWCTMLLLLIAMCAASSTLIMLIINNGCCRMIILMQKEKQSNNLNNCENVHCFFNTPLIPKQL